MVTKRREVEEGVLVLGVAGGAVDGEIMALVASPENADAFDRAAAARVLRPRVLSSSKRCGARWHIAAPERGVRAKCKHGVVQGVVSTNTDGELVEFLSKGKEERIKVLGLVRARDNPNADDVRQPEALVIAKVVVEEEEWPTCFVGSLENLEAVGEFREADVAWVVEVFVGKEAVVDDDVLRAKRTIQLRIVDVVDGVSDVVGVVVVMTSAVSHTPR